MNDGRPAKRKAPSASTETHLSTENKPSRWRCDVCLVRIFDTFHEALAHEKVCTGASPEESNALKRAQQARDNAKKVIGRAQKIHGTNNSNKRAKLAHDGGTASQLTRQEKDSGNAAFREDATPDKRNGNSIEPPSPAQSTPSALARLSDAATERMEKRNARVREAIPATGTAKTIPAGKSNQHGANKKKTNWMCDVCKVAIFEDYYEALEHEKNCKGPLRAPASTSKVQASLVAQTKDGDKRFICKPIGRKTQNRGALTVDDSSKSFGPPSKSPSFQQSSTSAFERPVPQTKSLTSVESDLCSIRGSASLDVANIMVGMPQSVGGEGVKPTLRGDEEARQPGKSDSVEVETSVGNGTLFNGVKKADVNGAVEVVHESTETDEGKAQVIGTGGIGNNGAAVRVLKKRRLVSLVLPLFVAVAALQRKDYLWPLFKLLTEFLLLSGVTFGAALIFTHQGQHHHPTQRNWLYELSMSAQDYLFEPAVGEDVNNDGIERPTLREFLAHEDGFHMAFAPAFFGFFCYFGALTALDEETSGRIVPSGTDECGLKSAAGASAGAMAAVMLASGIHPREAADFASKVTWGMVSDPPGLGGYVKGNKFEHFMRTFIKDKSRVDVVPSDDETEDVGVQLQDTLVPVAVSGFDLLRLKGVNLTRGCAARAARASAGFPGLFQPVKWMEMNSEVQRRWLPDALLIDGGITDALGLNGLSDHPSQKKKRIINVVAGDFGCIPSGIKDLPKGVNAESLVSISIVGTPMCGPWAMENGPVAVEMARQAMASMMDVPMERGTSRNHFVLRVDASKFRNT